MKTGIVICCSKKKSTINFNKMKEVLEKTSDYNLCFVFTYLSHQELLELNMLQKQFPKSVHSIKINTWKNKSLAIRQGVRYFYSRKDITYIGLLGEDETLDVNDFNLLKKSIQANSEISIAIHRPITSHCKSSNKFINRLITQFNLKVLKFRTGVSLKGAQGGKKLFTRSIAPIIFDKDAIQYDSNDMEIFVNLKFYLGRKNLDKHYCIL